MLGWFISITLWNIYLRRKKTSKLSIRNFLCVFCAFYSSCFFGEMCCQFSICLFSRDHLKLPEGFIRFMSYNFFNFPYQILEFFIEFSSQGFPLKKAPEFLLIFCESNGQSVESFSRFSSDLVFWVFRSFGNNVAKRIRIGREWKWLKL
jgi:hypothetical protein